MELIYSEEWKKKDEDRKDLTYSPLSKNLKEGVYLPIKTVEDRLMLSEILKNYE